MVVASMIVMRLTVVSINCSRASRLYTITGPRMAVVCAALSSACSQRKEIRKRKERKQSSTKRMEVKIKKSKAEGNKSKKGIN